MSDPLKRREEILRKAAQVPSLPASVASLLPLLEDPESSIQDIVKTMQYDPGLTANVLRLANSAYFAGPRPIENLGEAVVLLGTKRIFQLTLAASVAPRVKGAAKGYALSPGQLLLHSIAAGVGAEMLAKHLGVADGDKAFTAGLLHDIGKLVMSQFVEINGDEIHGVALAEHEAFEAAERQVLGIDSPEVAGALLGRWGLPGDIVVAVRWHLEPDKAPPQMQPLVDLVHCADVLALDAGIGASVEGLKYTVCAGTMERLHLDPEQKTIPVADLIEVVNTIREAL